MSSILEIKKQNFSLFGIGSQLEGEFHLSGPAKINSQLKGQLTMKNKAQLSIEGAGFVQGNIHCHDIEIFGTFKGELVASGRIIIWPTAFVEGRISGQSLTIYPGACVNIDGHTEEISAS